MALIVGLSDEERERAHTLFHRLRDIAKLGCLAIGDDNDLLLLLAGSMSSEAGPEVNWLIETLRDKSTEVEVPDTPAEA